jgi:hypothetical protein
MGLFDRARKISRMGREMAYLKADHPEAWAAGQQAAIEALQGRSDDLVRMLIQGPPERVEHYRSTMTEEIVTGVGIGEYEAPFSPLTPEGLKAFAISLGMKLIDVLEAERKERRRRVLDPLAGPETGDASGLGNPRITGEKWAGSMFAIALEDPIVPRTREQIDEYVKRVTPAAVEGAASTLGRDRGSLPNDFVQEFEAALKPRLASLLAQHAGLEQ